MPSFSAVALGEHKSDQKLEIRMDQVLRKYLASRKQLTEKIGAYLAITEASGSFSIEKISTIVREVSPDTRELQVIVVSDIRQRVPKYIHCRTLCLH